MSHLFVETWGEGTPVVLVHGSLAAGREEWQAQQPLAQQGYELRVPDRRGYGRSPAADGEDFLRDADEIGELMGDGAQLVGHSYGGLGAMYAAARRPEATLSLALLEPSASSVPGLDAEGSRLVNRIRDIWDKDAPDEEWFKDFLIAVGTNPASLPPEVLEEIVPLVPIARRGRPSWDAVLPLAELRAAAFPKLVVSGGHSAGFDAICDALAEQIGAARAVVPGAGHEIQFTGEPINDVFLGLWRREA
jgi:pimeloyl-ACP methyl ester carboxylesterase